MSNTCVISPLQPGERAFLLESTLDTLSETYPEFPSLGRIERRERAEALIARYAEHPGGCLVARAEEVPTGILWWIEDLHPITDERLGLILVVRVTPECRGRGFARALLQEAKREAAAVGIKHLRLFVNQENRPAYELYRSIGFTPQIVEMHWQ